MAMESSIRINVFFYEYYSRHWIDVKSDSVKKCKRLSIDFFFGIVPFGFLYGESDCAKILNKVGSTIAKWHRYATVEVGITFDC